MLSKGLDQVRVAPAAEGRPVIYATCGKHCQGVLTALGSSHRDEGPQLVIDQIVEAVTEFRNLPLISTGLFGATKLL